MWNIRHTPVDLKREKILTRIIIYLKIFISNKMDAIIYNSERSKVFHEGIGYNKDKSLVIPNGFNISKFNISKKIKVIERKKLNIDENEIVFGHVARFHPMKNHKMFIESASIISKHINNTKFLMVGTNINNENVFLSKLIKKYNLEKKIILLDEMLDLNCFYPLLDVFCLTSSWGESFPNVIGEAMLCGIPCVTTNIGDACSIIGKNGRCVTSGDAYQFSKNCIDLISENKQRKLTEKKIN